MANLLSKLKLFRGSSRNPTASPEEQTRGATNNQSGRSVTRADGRTTRGLRPSSEAEPRSRQKNIKEYLTTTALGKIFIKIGLLSPPPAPKPIVFQEPERHFNLPPIPSKASEARYASAGQIDSEASKGLNVRMSEKLLGEGQFGKVVLATPESPAPSKPERAVKISLNQSQSREIDIHARLDHPNIVSIKSAHRSPESLKPFSGKAGYAESIEMEFIGQDLEKVIKEPKRVPKKVSDSSAATGISYQPVNDASKPEGLPPTLCQKVIKGVTEGLKYIHHEIDPPVVHLDIHCSNIMVTMGGDAKLADFGCAWEIGSQHPVSSKLRSKIWAPELLYEETKDKAYTTKADMWALGCLLYETATGKEVCRYPPQKAKDHSKMAPLKYITTSAEKALQDPALQKQEHKQLLNLLNHLLDPNPKTRYSAEQALQHPYLADKPEPPTFS